jgi:triosephosphate isomerase
MAKKKIIIANWKMNPSSEKEADKLLSEVAKFIPSSKDTEIVVCPPFLYLGKLKKNPRKISLGAQNSASAEKGAFTGEVSATMLHNLNVKYVILGHSERRAMGESNIEINKKIRMAISSGLLPVLCVGEESRDAEHGYFAVVKKQIEECLKGISKALISKIIIAYEPVWAISTTVDRRDATPADSMEMVIFIRKIISDISSPKLAQTMRIIYGGSVNDSDAESFLRDGGVEGLLVGRASLDPKKFAKIVTIADNI